MKEKEAQKIIKDNEGKANSIINDRNKFKQFIEKVSNHKGLKEIGSNAKLLLSLMKDFFTGNYKEIPIGCIISIIGAFIYLLAPIDVIPDFIPFLGYVDDAAVIAACVKLIENDIKKYEAWRTSNSK